MKRLESKCAVLITALSLVLVGCFTKPIATEYGSEFNQTVRGKFIHSVWVNRQALEKLNVQSVHLKKIIDDGIEDQEFASASNVVTWLYQSMLEDAEDQIVIQSDAPGCVIDLELAITELSVKRKKIRIQIEGRLIDPATSTTLGYFAHRIPTPVRYTTGSQIVIFRPDGYIEWQAASVTKMIGSLMRGEIARTLDFPWEYLVSTWEL